MTETPTSSTGLLEAANATGVPATLRKKAQNWLVRLVGGTVGSEVVSAGRQTWDQVEGRSRVSQMLAEEVGRRAIADPDMMQRAQAHFLSDIFRKQENVEAVAFVALEELQGSDENHAEIIDEVDEDWINIFTRHAEAASSERMRQLWGKILAGEIRKTGSYAPTTMRILSELDQKTASDFSLLSEFIFGDYAAKLSDWNTGEFFDLGCRLETAGLINGGATQVNRITQSPSGDLAPIAIDKNLILLVKMPNGAQFPVFALTQAGKQLISLNERNLLKAARHLATALKQRGATHAEIGVIDAGGTVRAIEMPYTE
jgi:Protein of unknown function (DUF2806)